MARKPRSQTIVAGIPNHIMVRGNNRRRLFSYPHERLSYIRLLRSALQSFPVTLHALCLMSNHVHLLLTPRTRESVSAAMKRVNQRYAQIRNGKKRASGKLFEQAFESKPIESDAHLAYSVMYIDANPVRAGITGSFKWSSLQHHLGNYDSVVSSLLVADPWYLSLGEDRATRALEYERLFNNYLRLDEQPEELARFCELEETGTRPRRPDGKSAA